MDQRKLVSKLNKAAIKISNAGVYGSGNFLITNSILANALGRLSIREIRINKIRKILYDKTLG